MTALSYELAKELKDAGYPLKTTNFGPNSGPIPLAYFLDGQEAGIGYLPPTLPELIEACGDGIENIQKQSNGSWAAWQFTEMDGNRLGLEAEGSTPEEAVARLWLALHTSKGHPSPSDL